LIGRPSPICRWSMRRSGISTCDHSMSGGRWRSLRCCSSRLYCCLPEPICLTSLTHMFLLVAGSWYTCVTVALNILIVPSPDMPINTFERKKRGKM
jgi:hypothetical protein